jgi:cytochrome c-type biogenesis protein CcmH/NrfG
VTHANAGRSRRPEADRKRPDVARASDDQFNEAFHAILREAAERREVRRRLNVQQDTAEARQAWQELLSLAGAADPRG